MPRSGEGELPPSLEYGHRHRVGEVEAAIVRPHRQTQALVFGNLREYLGGQPARFRAEQEGIVAGITRQVVAHRAARGQCEQPRARDRCQAGGQITMDAQLRVFVVIQPGAAQTRVVKREPQRLDQVQLRAGVGAKANTLPVLGGISGW